jgi:segregation and condensation protein B
MNEGADETPTIEEEVVMEPVDDVHPEPEMLDIPVAEAPTLVTLLEATLFGAGKSLSQTELVEQFDAKESAIRMALLELKENIASREGCALQLTEINRYWVFEVKPELSDFIPRIARTEIPKRLLRAAALIAYHQPMQQSQLVDMLGQVTYEHVGDLRELGLIDKRRDGNTRRLTTTRRFSEYFGCPYTDTASVASWFKEQASAAGLTAKQLARALAEAGSDDDEDEPDEPDEQEHGESGTEEDDAPVEEVLEGDATASEDLDAAEEAAE